jgi:hypothetical protein
MPIGEAHKSGSSFRGLAEYILAQGVYEKQNNDKRPEIVFRNHLYSSNYLELGTEFREVAKENTRVTKPVMHLTVNFKTSDNISNENQKKFVLKIMDEMGVKEDNHQFLVVKHNDKHPHYHIQINRVGFDGKTLSDSNSKLRIGTACDKIEKEMGLDNYLEATRAFVYDEKTKTHKKNKNRKLNKGLTIVKASKNRQVGIQEKKDFIQIETLKAIDNHNVDSLEKLKAELDKRKITLKYSVNKKEQVAVSFQYDGLAVKGSQISLKGNLIKNQLLANQKANKDLYDSRELLGIIKDAKNRAVKSVSQIIKQYSLGKIPELKTIFKQNEILYKDNGNLEYKNLTIEAETIKRILKEFNEKLEKAEVKHQIKLKEYEVLQRTEFKKGFIGFLKDEQKRFNATLKEKLQHTKRPSLEVGIRRDFYIKEVLDSFNKVYDAEKVKKVIRYVGYSVDKSLDLNKKIALKVDEKKQKSLLICNNITQSQTKENTVERVVKRKIRR